MANPKKGTIQLENGYTKIANDLIEKLAKVKMSGQSWQVLFAIVRKLYGHNKKEDWIEYSQLMEITNLSKSRVCEAVAVLRKSGIVTQKRNGIRQMIAIIKDFELVPQNRNVPVFRKNRSGFPDTTVPVFSTTKETDTKDNIQKKDSNTSHRSEKAVRPDQIIVDTIEAFIKAGNTTLKYGNPFQRKAIERLVATHGETNVRKMTQYAISLQKTSYAPHVTNPKELEDKLQSLRDHYARESTKKGGIAIIS